MHTDNQKKRYIFECTRLDLLYIRSLLYCPKRKPESDFLASDIPHQIKAIEMYNLSKQHAKLRNGSPERIGREICQM